MRCATARDCRLARVLIREVMTESVVTAAPERTVREIAELMRERNVGSVVLVADERPVGFVTDRDLALSVIADGRDFGDHVADHASSPVITAEPAMDVEEAGELMVRHGDPAAGRGRRRPPDRASSRSTTWRRAPATRSSPASSRAASPAP